MNVPASNFDVGPIKRLIEILAEIKEGEAIIVSNHDLIFSDYGDVTFHLMNGH